VNKDSDEMEDENEQLAHNSSYSGQIPVQFRANLEFASQRWVTRKCPFELSLCGVVDDVVPSVHRAI
jgi:hypothetical protein